MIAHLSLLVLTTAAFLALCAGLPRYQVALLGRKITPVRSRRLRVTGWVLLGVALTLACLAFGLGRALVLQAGYCTLGALITVFMARPSGAPQPQRGRAPRHARQAEASAPLARQVLDDGADLPTLDADPLVDIANTMEIHALMENGRFHDPGTRHRRRWSEGGIAAVTKPDAP